MLKLNPMGVVMMALGGRPFGKYLGHGLRALINVISTVIKVAQGACLSLSPI